MIDVHAHLFFDELLGRAGPHGPAIRPVGGGGNELVTGAHHWPMGQRTTLSTTPQRRLEELAAAGISAQVLSLSPLWFFHHTDARTAGEFAGRANDLLAEFCSADPRRLYGVAVLPVQDVDAAIAELERATRDLGLLGGYIGTDARASLDAPDLDDLYAASVALNVPLVVHSTVAGVDGPPGDERLGRWLGAVTLGYPYEETLAIHSLVFGGVAERHPRLDILLPHGGGALPFLHGRLRAFACTAQSPITVEQFDFAVSRIHLDTHVHSPGALRLLMETVPHERLVHGTNFGGWDADSAPPVGEQAVRLDDNARRLFRIPDSGVRP
jgi:aminocarboxymuconate-semialdehyde decarboxylase